MIRQLGFSNSTGKSGRLLALGVMLVIVMAVALLALNLRNAPTAKTSANLDDETLNVAKGLYCPVCPSTPLDVCETQACVQWRALIREKLAAGESEEQIRQYFVAQYGERVLGAPPAEGFNIGAYVLPFVTLIAGGAFLFATMRKWQDTHAAAKTTTVEPPVSPEYAERIRRALKERE